MVFTGSVEIDLNCDMSDQESLQRKYDLKSYSAGRNFLI